MVSVPLGKKGDASDDEETPSPTGSDAADVAVAPGSVRPSVDSIFSVTDYDEKLANFDLEQRKDFFMRPLPEGKYMNCFLMRERTGVTKLQRRYVFRTDGGMLLAASKKVGGLTKKPYYLVSMDDSDMSRDGLNYVGKVRWNFMGSEFTAYGAGENFKVRSSPNSKMSPKAMMSMLSPRKNKSTPRAADNEENPEDVAQEVREEMAVIRYNAPDENGKTHHDGPRSMQIILPHVDADGNRTVCRPGGLQDPGLAKLVETSSQRTAASGSEPSVIDCRNLAAEWDDEVHGYVLNFNSRVKLPSVKNFQMIKTGTDAPVLLQFGRSSDDHFCLDFGHPLSPFQAFAIALSSCDYKICSA